MLQHEQHLSSKKCILLIISFFLATTFRHDALAQQSGNISCPDQEIGFFLSNKLYPTSVSEIFLNSTSSNVPSTLFNSTNPTKIIIHGRFSTLRSSSLLEIRKEYLKRPENYNIINVDWRQLPWGTNEIDVARNVSHVGECLAQLINRLRDIGADDFHLIGLGLGAQVSALTAKYLKPYQLSRITGLDPTTDYYMLLDDNDEKLDKSDAQFVDVYFTFFEYFSITTTVGHIDFYMNDGIIQPGCWEEDDAIRCKHHRAAFYFAESVNSKVGFWAWPCAEHYLFLKNLCPPKHPFIRAGDGVNKSDHGIYFCKTAEKRPFAKNIDDILREESEKKNETEPDLSFIVPKGMYDSFTESFVVN